MANYLDQNGLRYFWGKIKAKMPGPLQAYPVGSVYISISSNFNPNTSFGGTWERFGQGRTLIGEGTGNDGSTSMSFTANSTGGEYKHKITLKELPNAIWHSKSGEQTGGLKQAFMQVSTSTGGGSGINTLGTNFDQPHNNIQPYITVYFWKRTV